MVLGRLRLLRRRPRLEIIIQDRIHVAAEFETYFSHSIRYLEFLITDILLLLIDIPLAQMEIALPLLKRTELHRAHTKLDLLFKVVSIKQSWS